jgi:[acyl-carrier-protein] S-malonyltransferase
MSSTTLLFPGQGAQVVGMARDAHDAIPAARELFQQAGDILRVDLGRLCFEGPQESLNRTDVSQPAILVASLALLEGMKARRPEWVSAATAAAGLSLGEYTALVFAGAISFAEAVWLVQQRGRAMREACEASPGAMASILGLDAQKVEAACAHAVGLGLGPVIPANFNSPGQIVISGAKAAVEAASMKAKELGARRIVPLAVAGAFHSPLMASAQEKLRHALQDVLIACPRIPVISNVTAAPTREPEAIREALAVQVVSPVRWEASMRALIAQGARRFIEVGPGRVLTGLLKKIDETVETRNVETLTDLEVT